MTTFTPVELKLIAKCATMDDQDEGLRRLEEAFAGRGKVVVAHAAMTADRFAAKLKRVGEAVDLGDDEILMRVRETW